MINSEKQIEYWKAGAIDDFLSAEILIDRQHYLHGQFFCHLVIEKIIKAHIVKSTKEFAPRSHNLFYLSDKANLQYSEDEEIFLGILRQYQLQGRYPDYNPVIPDKNKIEDYLLKPKNLLECLNRKL
ncbi:HEPN domain-containing protein [Marinilabilia rubra]|uniref:DNA-binding protein n=1 Tax=Marinilabilia rubra TaxID=2162893 RepID=A0A2U2B3U3_9BACT|nr:HEPN domain-containing protein [Marinilabilia rubra]PWD97733.1 DNA-binding protein [Marinilabilia rubra]